MSRRKRTSAPVPVSAPVRREVVHHEPREPWLDGLGLTTSSFSTPRPVTMNWRQVCEDFTYVLPPWQRGQVWTSAQQVALCEAIWSGLPIAPLLLWERQTGPGLGDRVTVVLDGQQRLCALGARVLRHDGTPCAPPSAFLDLETGRWSAEPAPSHPPITFARATSSHWTWDRDGYRAQYDDATWWRWASLVAHASSRLGQACDSMAVHMGSTIDVERAVQVFRSWNVPGTLFDLAEVEALIRAADLSWRPGAAS